MSINYKMPKKNKTKKKPINFVEKRELLLKLDGTIYGQVVKILGDCNFIIFCFDGKERMCHLRKSVKKQIVSNDCIVLVGLRDYQDDKGDIVYVYQRDEVNELRKLKEIPDSVQPNNEILDNMNEDMGFDFESI